jgi:hypothetical protein
VSVLLERLSVRLARKITRVTLEALDELNYFYAPGRP